jgi:hypothetical protein
MNTINVFTAGSRTYSEFGNIDSVWFSAAFFEFPTVQQIYCFHDIDSVERKDIFDTGQV